MAKLPKKIALDVQNVDVRTFVSSVAQRPESASQVTRINMTMKNDDLEITDDYQGRYGATRVEVFRAGLMLLQSLKDEERRSVFSDIRKQNPKIGRPLIKK